MATATKAKTNDATLFQAGDYSVVADGGFFALLYKGAWEDGVETLAEGRAYARRRHVESLLERLFEAASALPEESATTAGRLEAALAAIRGKS